MSPNQLNYRSQGAGKFVIISLPVVHGNDLVPVIKRTKRLGDELKAMLETPVGHLGGNVSLLEFFWDSGLDAKVVEEKLVQFLARHTDLTIKFQEKTSFPLMGI